MSTTKKGKNAYAVKQIKAQWTPGCELNQYRTKFVISRLDDWCWYDHLNFYIANKYFWEVWTKSVSDFFDDHAPYSPPIDNVIYCRKLRWSKILWMLRLIKFKIYYTTSINGMNKVIIKPKQSVRVEEQKQASGQTHRHPKLYRANLLYYNKIEIVNMLACKYRYQCASASPRVRGALPISVFLI